LTASSYGQYTRRLQRLFNTGSLKGNVYSAARPGNTSGEYLEYLGASNIIRKINPHILVIMLGTNDVRIDGDHTETARFEENMRKIIALIENYKKPGSAKFFVFLATIPPIFKCDLATFDKTSQRRVEQEIVPVIRKLAGEKRLHLLDVYRFFEKKPHLLPGIHPSKEGYRAMAEFMFADILKTCRKKQ
ncbi:MAG: SGNH/GDSL hydrolase family protein, partial [Candidatus Aminicenantes bacterium]|nr:SGNH/GDSL hydrolase family protein [Candidatus Aminicenantes bacterium]